jgi:hypothetical protein
MRALIVKDPWATEIVKGQKTIEYRNRPTNIRERIGIIKAGSGCVIGEVDLVDCREDPPMTYFCWGLKNAKEYKKPKPYKHPRGAQVWVNIER